MGISLDHLVTVGAERISQLTFNNTKRIFITWSYYLQEATMAAA
jgi:hypothetical protein